MLQGQALSASACTLEGAEFRQPHGAGKRRLKAVWGIAVALAAASGAALAQAASAQSALPERRMDIQISGRATYDSNTVRRRATLPSDSLEAEDVRFTPSAILDIVFPISRQALFLSGSVGYDFYARNTQLNRERINLSGGADLRFGAGCSTRLSGNYTRQQSSLADLFSTERLINTEEIKTFGAQAACSGAVGLRPGFGYQHQTSDNSNPFRQRTNYVSDSFNVSIGYVRPTFGELSLFSSYSKTTYPNRPIIVGMTPLGRDEAVEIYSAGGRFDRQIGSRLHGTVSLGITRADPNTPGVPGFSGLSYSADIGYTPNDRFNMTLAFSRSANVSNNIDANYSVNDTYALDANYALSRRLRLNFGTSYSERDFQLSPNIVNPLTPTGDKTYYGYVGATYRLNERLNFDTDFSQERRDAPGTLFDYKSTRISAGFRLNI